MTAGDKNEEESEQIEMADYSCKDQSTPSSSSSSLISSGGGDKESQRPLISNSSDQSLLTTTSTSESSSLLTASDHNNQGDGLGVAVKIVDSAAAKTPPSSSGDSKDDGEQKHALIGHRNRGGDEHAVGYKECLMRVWGRKGLMVLLGVLLWIAVIVLLALAVGGRSSTNEQFGSGEATSTHLPPTTSSVVDTIDPKIVGGTAGGGGGRTIKPATTASTSKQSAVVVVTGNPEPKQQTTTAGKANNNTTTTSSVVISSTIKLPVEPTTITTTTTAATASTTTTATTTVYTTARSTNAQVDEDEAVVTTVEDAVPPTTRPTFTTTTTTGGARRTFATTSGAREKLEKMVATTTRTGEMFDISKFVKENEGKMNYMIGVGRGDITGPSAEVAMMGYANMDQQVSGIHTRLYARTFMIGDNTENGKPFLFINTDACMGATLLKLELLKKLRLRFGNKFTGDNICITGTHTHSAPAGYLQDVLFQITSKGYIPETVDSMVAGIMVSIEQAHASYAPGWIFMNKGELLNTNINRSPTAYLSNPLKERRQYKYTVDKDMTLLKFVDAQGNGIGMINWFPVHCTSMNMSNTLISSDNKGYAELLFEQAMDPSSLVGHSKFVAAFAQSHEGDVSPNTRGARCIDTGLPCDAVQSSCGDSAAKCIAFGPGKDMFDSTKIIGTNQYLKAMELYDSAEEKLEGPVQFIKQNVNMTDQEVTGVGANGNETRRTCQPAMGYSFAAGTTDGPGVFDFKQGDTKGNSFWNAISRLLKKASPQQEACHHPKPILVDSGEMTKPYEWQPKVVETQILRIGKLVVNAIPAEFTTMSGRRLMKAVRKVFERELPDEDFEVVIAGLSNAYSDYVTTYEEYQVQRYEGASTIYGPYTLQAYIQQYEKLAEALIHGRDVGSGPQLHNLRHKLFNLNIGVLYDRPPTFRSFGDMHTKAHKQYNVSDEVMVEFVTAHPKNSPSINMTFCTVEREVNATWEVVHTDADWCTKFEWSRDRSLVGDTSEAKCFWKIPPHTASGTYRIGHFAHAKPVFSKPYAVEGFSNSFAVVNSNRH